MSHPFWAWGLCLLIPLGGRSAWADDAPRFHYSISSKPKEAGPFQFPLELIAGQSRDAVIKSLQDRGYNQGDFDRDFTIWSIRGKYETYKSFEPTAVTLAYSHFKLMQVTLVQSGMTDCKDIITMIEDAVAFIQSHYVFPKENVQTAPRFGSNNCVAYMKPGQSGWQAWDGDYSVNIDSNWRDMKYIGYVTFTYMPLYTPKADVIVSTTTEPAPAPKPAPNETMMQPLFQNH